MGVLAAMVTTGPLAVDKEARMVHALKQDILSTVCKQNGADSGTQIVGEEKLKVEQYP